MLVELERQIAERYRDEDAAWAEAARVAYDVIEQANRKVNDVFRKLTGDLHVYRDYVACYLPRQPNSGRSALRREAERQVDARVKAALLQVERQEADLLRDLGVDAIESQEAQAFLARIPAAAELVPTTRLVELEAELDAEENRP